MKCLVIGIGHAGERHIKNLRTLGVKDISVFDLNIDYFRPEHSSPPDQTPADNRFGYLVKKYGVSFYDPETFHEDFDFWVIATPPAHHMRYAVMGLQHGSHLFIEKPVSHDMEYVDWLWQMAKNRDTVIHVGYQLRFNNGLKMIKDMIESDRVGKLCSINATFGQWLPDWHKDSDYHELYTGKASEGGGIILDASHELDYVRWLAGSDIARVQSQFTRASGLDIDVEDNADILFLFENGVTGNIHLDCINREYTRECTIIGTKGTIKWVYNAESLVITNGKNTQCIGVTQNNAYLDEMQAFLQCIKDSDYINRSLADGIYALKLAVKIKGGTNGTKQT